MSIDERLERIEALLRDALTARPKEWYTVAEFADRVGKATFTVRQWCNHGRVNAKRCNTCCGQSREWRLSHAELQRYEREGLLPQERRSH